MTKDNILSKDIRDKFHQVVHLLILYLLTFFVSMASVSCHTSRKGTSSRGKHKQRTEHTIKAKDVKIGTATRRQKAIVKEALEWMGTPYGFGKADKGKAADCSGIVMQVYLDVTGKKLPRTSAKQSEYCQRIKPKDVQVGDLVFFATGKSETKVTHVGIMLNDREFVHASSTKGVIISNMEQPYWTKAFLHFGRVP